MIKGKIKQWDVPAAGNAQGDGTYAVRWSTTVCRECRNEYLRYWEGQGTPERLVVGRECFHLTDDQWAPDFRRAAVR